jgi:cathepsin F
MEGAHFLATKNLVSLSEQSLVDCVHGGQCNCQTGGLMSWAFEYVISAGGIVSETTDPYKGASTTCNVQKKDFVASFTSYANMYVLSSCA